MSWAGRLARRAAGSAVRGAVRGTGSFLSNHVLPDTLVPSWKTQKRLGRAAKAVGSLAKQSRRALSPKTSSKHYRQQTNSSPRTGNTARPQRGGLQTFNRNAWQRGDALRSSDRYSASPSRSSRAAEVQAKVKRVQAQARDILLNPRAVGRMFWDELKFDAQKKKQQLLSKLRR